MGQGNAAHLRQADLRMRLVFRTRLPEDLGMNMLVAGHLVAKRAWHGRGEGTQVASMWEGLVNLAVVMM